MDQLSGHQEVEIPMPINSAYVGGVLHGHGHAHHHGHDMTHHHDAPPPSSSIPHQIIIPQQSSQNGISANNMEEDEEEGELGQGYNGNLTGDRKKKGVVRVRYRECLKNHAATMGGNARDGCGEFMASGEEGSIEALTCSACNCHRNFHRKEFEGEQHLIIPSSANSPFYPPTPHSAAALLGTSRGRKVILGSANVIPFSARSVPPINMAYLPPSDQDHHHDHHGNGGGVMIMRQPLNHLDHHQHHQHQMVNKKRFRTKFSQEQKEKMLEFAERIGWKFQKQEEGVVQQFCQEIGVKRRVLKVWMHNNKHTLATKTNNNNNNNNNINSSSSI